MSSSAWFAPSGVWGHGNPVSTVDKKEGREDEGEERDSRICTTPITEHEQAGHERHELEEGTTAACDI